MLQLFHSGVFDRVAAFWFAFATMHSTVIVYAVLFRLLNNGNFVLFFRNSVLSRHGVLPHGECFFRCSTQYVPFPTGETCSSRVGEPDAEAVISNLLHLSSILTTVFCVIAEILCTTATPLY